MNNLFDPLPAEDADGQRLLAAGWEITQHAGLPHWRAPGGNLYQDTRDALRELERREKEQGK